MFGSPPAAMRDGGTGRPGRHDRPSAQPGLGAAEAQIAYRPEIDGLRAVAILAVVLYHAGFPLMPGGFTGVDVFFVLSGFLIGSLLWSELKLSGSIALGAFWMRRLRRLAPAYLTVALATLAAGYLILLPFDLRELGKEVIAATLWVSNFLFWRSAGYFDGAASEKPMLHTWSLSVEEQFYLVLPLALVALALIRTKPAAMVAVLGGIWAMSLAATLLMTASQPDAAFFLFPFRAWELLTGVLLAAAPALSDRARATAGCIGLGLILFGLVAVRSEGFPGWQSIIPVAGTALALTAARQDTPWWPGQLLAKPLPVFLGKISYGFYLWHWPVLVLAEYWRGQMVWVERAAWILLAAILAVASWRLIETPLRRPAMAGGPREQVLLAGVGCGAVVVLALGMLAYERDGLPSRFSPELRAHIDASGDFVQDWSRCHVPVEGPFAGLEACAIGPEGSPRVLFWGDSHLRALMDGLAEAAVRTGTPGLVVWRAGCPPLLGISKRESAATPSQDAACPATIAKVMTAIRTASELQAVVLVGRWTYYAEGMGVGRDAHNQIELSALPGSGYTAKDQAALYAQAMFTTAEELSGLGLRVAVLRQVSEIPDYSSRDVARSLAHGRLDSVSVQPLLVAQPEEVAHRVLVADAPLLALEQLGTIELIDPWPLLCRELCGVMSEGHVIYFDNNHLTNSGAHQLSPLFEPILGAASQ